MKLFARTDARAKTRLCRTLRTLSVFALSRGLVGEGLVAQEKIRHLLQSMGLVLTAVV